MALLCEALVLDVASLVVHVLAAVYVYFKESFNY